MKTQLRDGELIRQYLTTQSNGSFEVLYNRYVGKVYRRCLSLTKDAEKAQDYTQDIFIRTFEHLDRFQEKSSFSTWLYSISFNYCMDQIKRSARLQTTPLEDRQTDQWVDADEPEAEERLHQLTTALNRLPDGEVSLLQMKYQQGMNIQQIATVLNLKESAVKMRLKRSREKLKLAYDQVNDLA